MKDEKLYLIHITECIGRIEFYTKGGRQEFMQSTLVQDAVIRNFEVIGEATKQLSMEVKDAFPTLPCTWRINKTSKIYDSYILHPVARDRRHPWCDDQMQPDEQHAEDLCQTVPSQRRRAPIRARLPADSHGATNRGCNGTAAGAPPGRFRGRFPRIPPTIGPSVAL